MFVFSRADLVGFPALLTPSVVSILPSFKRHFEEGTIYFVRLLRSRTVRIGCTRTHWPTLVPGEAYVVGMEDDLAGFRRAKRSFTVPYTAAPLGDQKEEEERAWTFIELGYVIKDEWQTEAKRLVFEPPSTKPSPRKMARTNWPGP